MKIKDFTISAGFPRFPGNPLIARYPSPLFILFIHGKIHLMDLNFCPSLQMTLMEISHHLASTHTRLIFFLFLKIAILTVSAMIVKSILFFLIFSK